MFFFTYVYEEGTFKLNEYQFSTDQCIQRKMKIEESAKSVGDELIGNIVDFQFSKSNDLQNDNIQKTKSDWMGK